MRTLKQNIFAGAMLVAFFAIAPYALAQTSHSNELTYAGNDVLASWDINSDNYIDLDEFDSGLDDIEYYDLWDTNNNDVISESEWTEGVDIYLPSYNSVTFNAWDENGDGVIKEDEFDNGLFDVVDSDADDTIENDEFYNWFNGVFYVWDINSDNYIDADEFDSGLDDIEYYDSWDMNNNGVISESEWNNVFNTYLVAYSSGPYDNFNAWDENGDGVIKEDEFDNGLFDFVDRDSNDRIENDEFTTMLFGWWPGEG